jgi:hypothetical protein
MPEINTSSRSKSYSTCTILFTVVPILLGLGISFWFHSLQRAKIAPYLSNHPVVVMENLIPKDVAKDLLDVIKTFQNYSSNVDQSKAQGFEPLYEDIGEAQPINEDGTCTHKFLFPNMNKSKCIPPQRVDIGKHYVMTGGIDGSKEMYQDLVDRVSSFGRYTFISDLDQYPAVKKLFESEKFQEATKSICPVGKKYLNPFQFNFIIQVPGQTVALHIDSPYFWGASRFEFPQWLIVAMVFSNLFSEKFIDQVQVVGYLHQWDPSNTIDQGGEFVWYNNDTSFESVLPTPNSGSLVDGSKVIHASTIYRPKIKAPHLDKNKDSVLRFVGDNKWVIQSNGEIIQNYTTDDLRIAIVYRARCFKDEEDVNKYKNYEDKIKNKNFEDVFELSYILDTFTNDLIKRNILTENNKNNISRLDLAFLIIDTYIQYPLPPAKFAQIPYNFCALPLKFPITKYFLKYVCN